MKQSNWTSLSAAMLALFVALLAGCSDDSPSFIQGSSDTDADTDTDSDTDADTDTDTDSDTDSDTDTDTDTDSDSDTDSDTDTDTDTDTEPEICDDDIDNDLDTLEDCDDTDCWGDTDNCPCYPNVCQDLLDYVLGLFGVSCGDPTYDPVADVDKNTYINITDVSLVLNLCNDATECQNTWDDDSNPCP